MNAKQKVNIFLIGSRKSATTSMANFLNNHVDISLSSIKEPNFFDAKSIGTIKTITEYHKLFDWSTKYQLDASTNYTTYPICDDKVAARIYEYNSSAKLIYLVRNPIDRIKSHYKMSYERGDLTGSLDDALLSHRLLLICSKYYEQISRYLEIFPKENILILNIDEISKNDSIKKIESFLELQTSFVSEMRSDNMANTDYRMPRKMDPILNHKAYNTIKKIMPISFVKLVKKVFFQKRNSNISIELSEMSLHLIRKELWSDMDKLQDMVDFDISDWKNI